MKRLLILLLFLLVKTVSAEVYLNEIMYNPTQDEDYNEWIEIYNPLDIEIDIANFTLCNDRLLSGYINRSGEICSDNGTKVPAKGFALITDGRSGTEVYSNFNVSNNSIALHVESARICTGLNNNADLILIKDNDEEIIDALYYTSEWGADGNGKTLCKIPDQTGLWRECINSPGETNELETDYSKIKINEFLPDPHGYDNELMPEGEWVELYNNGEKEIDLKEMYLEDKADHRITVTSLRTETTIIKPYSYLVVYMNGFSGFLNNDRDEITLYDPNNNQIDQISYDDTEEALSWSYVNGLWLKTIPTPNEENYEEPPPKTAINIETIYLGRDEKASFGDTLRVEVSVFKGNLTKYSVQLYAQDKNGEEISKRTKFNMPLSFTNTTLTIPVQLIPNCNLKYKDDIYTMILSGLDERDEKKFRIEGITSSLCQEKKETKKNATIEFIVVETPTEVNINEEIKIKINIKNNEADGKKVEVWSYIYKGPKSVSGERTSNVERITLPPHSSVYLTLKNQIEESTQAGEYKLKILYKEEDKKTPKEFIQTINLLGYKEENILKEAVDESIKSTITGNAIFTGTSEKAKRSGIYLLAILLILVIIELVRRKDI